MQRGRRSWMQALTVSVAQPSALSRSPTSTVQAPQSPSAQPSLVPVSRSWRRRIVEHRVVAPHVRQAKLVPVQQEPDLATCLGHGTSSAGNRRSLSFNDPTRGAGGTKRPAALHSFNVLERMAVGRPCCGAAFVGPASAIATEPGGNALSGEHQGLRPDRRARQHHVRRTRPAADARGRQQADQGARAAARRPALQPFDAQAHPDRGRPGLLRAREGRGRGARRCRGGGGGLAGRPRGVDRRDGAARGRPADRRAAGAGIRGSLSRRSRSACGCRTGEVDILEDGLDVAFFVGAPTGVGAEARARSPTARACSAPRRAISRVTGAGTARGPARGAAQLPAPALPALAGVFLDPGRGRRGR
jgi:hypothetical protein